ncbi:MAG: hypothetical protein U9Q29_02045 [Campylobacterota bacterium]|nr:hypothetical protein [Campylobacterota bacterium]
MIKILTFMIIALLLEAKNWEIKRNPFTVSDAYIEKTKKSYLEPKNNYIPFNIKLIGVTYVGKTKEAILDIEFEGICEIGLYKRIKVNTPDIESWIKVIHISESFVLISLNGGEGIRYEIQ